LKTSSELSDGQRVSLTKTLMSRVSRPDSHKPFGLYFVSSDGDWGELARCVEREVFAERFGNDTAEMDSEYGKYELSSFFILVVDHQRFEPVGEFRIVEDSPAGFKTLNDIEREPGWKATKDDFVRMHCPTGDLSHVIDAATLAVRPEWSSSASGSMVSVALYGGLFRAVIALRTQLLVTTLDESVAGLLRATEVPIEPLCDLPAIEYLGSPATRPYVVNWHTIDAARHESPALMGVLMGGMVDHEFSLPPIDLDNPNPHPTEIEPQYIDPARDLQTKRTATQAVPLGD